MDGLEEIKEVDLLSPSKIGQLSAAPRPRLGLKNPNSLFAQQKVRRNSQSKIAIEKRKQANLRSNSISMQQFQTPKRANFF